MESGKTGMLWVWNSPFWNDPTLALASNLSVLNGVDLLKNRNDAGKTTSVHKLDSK
jgi:hypothetical protein